MSQIKNLNTEKQNQHRQSISYNIFHQLEDNNLVRKPLEEQSNSLFEAISTGIFYTPIHSDKILLQCKNHLKTLAENENLPAKLNKFTKIPGLLQDYLFNPSLKGFENTNLELVSLIYQVKIVIYYISEDFQLHAQFINNKFEKTISLLKTGQTHYDLLFTKQEFQGLEVSQQILSEIVLDKFQINLNKRSESFFNNNDQDSQYSGRLHSNSIISQDDNFSNFHKNSLTSRQRHKKSMSETNLAVLDKQTSYNLFGTNNPPIDLFSMFVGREKGNSTDNLSPLKNDLTSQNQKNVQKKEEELQKKQSSKKSDDFLSQNNSKFDDEYIDNKEYQQILNKHQKELEQFKKRQQNLRKTSDINQKIPSCSSLEEDSREFLQPENLLENKYKLNQEKNQLSSIQQSNNSNQSQNSLNYQPQNQQQNQFQKSRILNQQFTISQQNLNMQKQSQHSYTDDNNSSVDHQVKQTLDKLESSENPSLQKNVGSNMDINSFNFGNQQASQQYQNRYKIKGYLGQPQFKSDNNLFDLKPIENEPKQIFNQNSFYLNSSNNNNYSSQNQGAFQQPKSLHNLDDFQSFQSNNLPPFLFQSHSQQQQQQQQNQNQNQQLNMMKTQLQNLNLNSNANNFHTQESTNSSFINCEQPQKQQPNYAQQQQQFLMNQQQNSFQNKSPYRGNSPQKQQQSNQNINQLLSQQGQENNGQLSTQRYIGRLKFFDENKNYGFLICEHDNSDIFVHFDDLEKASITKQFLKQSKLGNIFRFSFSCLNYIGRHNKSRKAVDLEYLANDNTPNPDFNFDNNQPQQQQQQLQQQQQPNQQLIPPHHFQNTPFRQPLIQSQQSDEGLNNLGLNQPQNSLNFQFQQQPFNTQQQQQQQNPRIDSQQQQQQLSSSSSLQYQQQDQFYNYLQPNNQQFNPM